VEYLIERYAKQAGKRFRSVSRRSLDLMQAYNWPGNIRELQNVIERAVILSDGDSLSVNETWLHGDAPTPSGPTLSINTHIVDHERQMIETALAETAGKISGPTGAPLASACPGRRSNQEFGVSESTSSASSVNRMKQVDGIDRRNSRLPFSHAASGMGRSGMAVVLGCFVSIARLTCTRRVHPAD
jgi:hypothetical protein